VNPLFYGCFSLFETTQKNLKKRTAPRRTPVNSPVGFAVKKLFFIIENMNFIMYDRDD